MTGSVVSRAGRSLVLALLTAAGAPVVWRQALPHDAADAPPISDRNCFDSANRAVGNAVGYTQLAVQPAEAWSQVFACETQVTERDPRLEPCWTELRAEKSLVDQMVPYFERMQFSTADYQRYHELQQQAEQRRTAAMRCRAALDARGEQPLTGSVARSEMSPDVTLRGGVAIDGGPKPAGAIDWTPYFNDIGNQVRLRLGNLIRSGARYPVGRTVQATLVLSAGGTVVRASSYPPDPAIEGMLRGVSPNRFPRGTALPRVLVREDFTFGRGDWYRADHEYYESGGQLYRTRRPSR